MCRLRVNSEPVASGTCTTVFLRKKLLVIGCLAGDKSLLTVLKGVVICICYSLPKGLSYVGDFNKVDSRNACWSAPSIGWFQARVERD